MADLTPGAQAALQRADSQAGHSTDFIAFAVVSALEAVAHELAALREEVSKTPEQRHREQLLNTLTIRKQD